MVASFSLDSVHIYGATAYTRLDTAMASESLSPSNLEVGDQTSVTTSVGPYRLHLDVQKLDNETFEVFGKGVEQTRPMLLGSDALGPVSNALHGVLYDKIVRPRYDVGAVLDESQIESMRL